MTIRAAITWQPRLMGAAEAVRYLGVSATTLHGLPIPRRELGARRLYDRHDLDAYASDLPYEGQVGSEAKDAQACDEAFGLCS